ncbi:MAG: M90 family metallopeptidase [Kiritimatiellales bacterium]
MHPFCEKHRRAVRARPFPPEWLRVIQNNVSYFRLLTPEEQSELQSLIAVFIDEKSFEGCGGLEMTDEIRVTIAAQACILLLHRETDDYPQLKSILVYPHPYHATGIRRGPGNLMMQGEETRLGESWQTGAIVLAWDAVQGGAADVHDGHNVVYHEFAHQLDAEDGAVNGSPALPHRSMYSAWARVLGAEYEHLIQETHRRHRTVLDEYGAQSPAEFFAVATETFFEKPVQLLRRHPALYEELRLFYNQNPALRFADGKP